jgi:hypothetical protein
VGKSEVTIPGEVFMRNAFTLLATLVVLLILPGGTAAADSRRTSDAPATVDARHTSLLKSTPVVETDARHAALVVRVGARPRIAQPQIASGLDRATPVTSSAARRGYWIEAAIAAGIACVILGVGAVMLVRRRKPAVA